jgi:hypothetical protein
VIQLHEQVFHILLYRGNLGQIRNSYSYKRELKIR